jgi:hypothetical protein
LAAHRDADAGKQNHTLTVWEVPAGLVAAQLAELPTDETGGPAAWPIAFSGDGERLLDAAGRVWAIDGQRKLCQVPDRSIQHDLAFTLDGQDVMATAASVGGNWLSYWHIATNSESLERRIPLEADPLVSWGTLMRPAADGPLLFLQGLRHHQPSAFRYWLENNLSIPRPGGSPTYIFAVVDLAAVREVCRCDGLVLCGSADGRLLVSQNDAGAYELWELPVRRPLRWLLPAFAAWSACLALLTYWRIRRLKRSSPTAPCSLPPAPATLSV